jgi:hypothetical protein
MGKADCENPVTQQFGGFASVLCIKHVLKPVCTHKDPRTGKDDCTTPSSGSSELCSHHRWEWVSDVDSGGLGPVRGIQAEILNLSRQYPDNESVNLSGTNSGKNSQGRARHMVRRPAPFWLIFSTWEISVEQ